MTTRYLTPWRRTRRGTPGTSLAVFQDAGDLLHGLFHGLFEPEGPATWGGLTRTAVHAPAVNVSQTDTEYRVSVELPGMSRDDVEVTIEDGCLVITGEKKEEKKEEKENYLRVERSHGSFTRTIPLETGVDEDGIEAAFKDGVLSVLLPKTQPETRKKVTIKSG